MEAAQMNTEIQKVLRDAEEFRDGTVDARRHLLCCAATYFRAVSFDESLDTALRFNCHTLYVMARLGALDDLDILDEMYGEFASLLVAVAEDAVFSV